MLVLRREGVDHEHFHAPSVFPVLGAIVSMLLAVGAVLWVVNRVADG